MAMEGLMALAAGGLAGWNQGTQAKADENYRQEQAKEQARQFQADMAFRQQEALRQAAQQLQNYNLQRDQFEEGKNQFGLTFGQTERQNQRQQQNWRRDYGLRWNESQWNAMANLPTLMMNAAGLAPGNAAFQRGIAAEYLRPFGNGIRASDYLNAMGPNGFQDRAYETEVTGQNLKAVEAMQNIEQNAAGQPLAAQTATGERIKAAIGNTALRGTYQVPGSVMGYGRRGAAIAPIYAPKYTPDVRSQAAQASLQQMRIGTQTAQLQNQMMRDELRVRQRYSQQKRFKAAGAPSRLR